MRAAGNRAFTTGRLACNASSSTAASHVKIATFNINGVNTRLPALLEWLRREQPDVACLQELKAPEEAFPSQAIAEAGYGAIWHGQKSWNPRGA